MLALLIVALTINAGLIATWVYQARMLARERAERRITDAMHARDVQALGHHHKRQHAEHDREAAVLQAAASVIDRALRGDRGGNSHE